MLLETYVGSHCAYNVWCEYSGDTSDAVGQRHDHAGISGRQIKCVYFQTRIKQAHEAHTNGKEDYD